MDPATMNSTDLEVKIDPLSTISHTRQISTSSTDSSTSSTSSEMEEKFVPPQHLPSKDTGLSAYVILAAVTCIESAVLAPSICYGIFENYYAETFPHNRIASWIGVLMSATAFLGSPLITWLCQKYTIRRETYVLCGTLTCISSFVVAAFMPNLAGLIVTQGLMFGVGSAFVDLPSLIILNTWFEKRRGFSYGIVFAGGDLLGAAYCFLAQHLLSTLSFRSTMLIIAAMTAGLASPALFFLKERLDTTDTADAGTRKSSTTSKVEFQKLSDKETAVHTITEVADQSEGRRASLDGLRPPRRVTTGRFDLPFSPAPGQQHLWPPLQPQRRYYQRGLFYVFTVANVLQSFAYYLPFIYLPTYATQFGLSRSQATIILALANVAQVFGDLGFGKLSDKLHVNYLVIITTGISSMATFVLWGRFGAGSIAYQTLIAYGVIFGTFGAGFLSLWARIGTLFGQRDSQVIYSTLCAGRGVATVLSGPVSQALLSARTASILRRLGYGPFAGLIFFVGICNAIAAVMGVSAVAVLRMGKMPTEEPQDDREKLLNR